MKLGNPLKFIVIQELNLLISHYKLQERSNLTWPQQMCVLITIKLIMINPYSKQLVGMNYRFYSVINLTFLKLPIEILTWELVFSTLVILLLTCQPYLVQELAETIVLVSKKLLSYVCWLLITLKTLLKTQETGVFLKCKFQNLVLKVTQLGTL